MSLREDPIDSWIKMPYEKTQLILDLRNIQAIFSLILLSRTTEQLIEYVEVGKTLAEKILEDLMKNTNEDT